MLLRVFVLLCLLLATALASALPVSTFAAVPKARVIEELF